jgi:hypothetical protein
MTPRWSTPIPDEQAGEVLRWYEGLEAQVGDFIRVVPPHGPHNLNSWSSQLATVLVEACCLIESILYQFKDDAATAQPDLERPARKDHRLEDYAKLYGSLLRLPERTVIFFPDTPEPRKPFSSWADLPHGEPFKSPEWWKLYNRSKHRRIGAFSEFTLTMAINALAGALIVISTVPAFTPMMVRREWLPLAGWQADALVRDYWQTLQGQRATAEEWPFTVTRQLFALPIGHGQLPADLRDLCPLDHGPNPMLHRYFFKF